MLVTISELSAKDEYTWITMRGSLWPKVAREGHLEEISRLLASDKMWAFVASVPDGQAVGFAELAIRDYANGCTNQPVPFLEGIWVSADWRRQGVGVQLIEHLEAFLLERGYPEMCSDTNFQNEIAQAAHKGWGFSETTRVVYFRKPLKKSLE